MMLHLNYRLIMASMCAALLCAAGCAEDDDDDSRLGSDAVSGDASTDATGPWIRGDASSCGSHMDCANGVCDPVSNHCVECNKDHHCEAPNPICSKHSCTGCTRNDHCSGNKECLKDQRRCVEPGQFEIRPAPLTFSSVPVGAEMSRIATIENTGRLPVEILDVRLEEHSGGQWDEKREIGTGGNWPTNYVLEAGESRGYELLYAPVNEKDDRAELTVAAEDGRKTIQVEGQAR